MKTLNAVLLAVAISVFLLGNFAIAGLPKSNVFVHDDRHLQNTNVGYQFDFHNMGMDLFSQLRKTKGISQLKVNTCKLTMKLNPGIDMDTMMTKIENILHMYFYMKLLFGEASFVKRIHS